MTPCEVDYALQTLMSKIKERELESQRTLNEHEVTNRVLKRQLLDLQNKLKEKEFQLADANETIRALRGVTQIITGLEDEIRALRTQLLTSQPIIPQIPNPAAISSPIRTQASDDLSHCSFRHPTEAGPTCSDYSSQNSIQNCTLLKMISESGRTTEVAVPRIKEEEQEVEMDGLERGGGEDGEKEEQALEEMVKLENDSEWDGSFEYNHAVATPGSSSQSSDSAAVPNATNSRKRQLVDAPLDGHSASVTVAQRGQPVKARAKKRLQGFKQRSQEWASSMKRNRNVSHFIDDIEVAIEKMKALGMRPFLMYAVYNDKGSRYESKVICPYECDEETNKMIGKIEQLYKLLLQVWTPQDDESR